MSFEEAGFQAAGVGAKAARPRSRLELRTRELLEAVERETGERPVLGDDEEPPTADESRRVRRRAAGWAAERAALATEVLRATDTREARVGPLSRARMALRWELLLGARLSEVDQRLVQTALSRADEVLPAPPPARHAFEWPLDPVRVTSGFGWRSDPLGEGSRRHSGVDLAAVVGQIVRTAGPGEVVFAGARGGYGLHVEVRHGDELVTRYAHLSEIEVATGERLRSGSVVGRAGRSGRSTGPHLHFELWRDGLPVDPEEELPAVQSPVLSRIP